MNCEQVKNLISLYIDNELDEKECSEFEDHISSCESCRNELNDILKIVKLLRSIPQVELPSNFKAQLHEKLIKAKEEEKLNKRKGLLFVGNSYFKAISGIAAVVLVVFAIRGLFFGGSMTKWSMNKYTADSTAPEIGIMEKALPKTAESSMHEATDEVVAMFDVAGQSDKGVDIDVSANQNAESDDGISEKESSLILSSNNKSNYMLSINPNTTEAQDSEGTEEELNTGSDEKRGFIVDTNFTENTFLKNAMIRVKIMIYENAAKMETLEKVIRNYETSGNIVERNVSDKESNVSILEFNIKGSDYANLANNIKSEIDTSTLSVKSNLSVELGNPVLVEDFKVKYNEYVSQLNTINNRLSTLAEDKNNSNSSEKARLMQDKDNIENNIKLLLENFEYVANAEMRINVQK